MTTLDLNGTSTNRIPAKSKASKSRKTTPPTKRRSRKWTLQQRVACIVGGVGCTLLLLSVHHCTEAIALLTGSPIYLACLLAIGIDAGMVASELAELVGVSEDTRRWAQRYVITAIVLSMLLNSYAFGLHATAGMIWAGVILGIVVPALVYATGRIAGHLWQE